MCNISAGPIEPKTETPTPETSVHPRFHLGHIVATPAALQHLDQTGISPQQLLARHAAGDWGELSQADQAENELSVREGFRILSRYTIGGKAVWVITEADRSSTCMLFPNEY